MNPNLRTVGLADHVHRLFALAGAVVYVAVLQQCYVSLVEPYYAYMGYQIHSRDWQLILLGSLLAVMPVLIAPMRLDRPSAFVGWLLYMLVHVPTVTIPFWSLAESGRYVVYAMLQAGVMLAVFSIPNWPAASLRPGGIPPLLRRSVLPLLTLGLTGLTISAFGFRAPNLSLDFAYEARAAYVAQAQGAGRLASYGAGWLGLSVAPLLIALALARRRYALALLAVLLHLYLYGLTGYKSLLFALPLTLGGWVVARSGFRFAGPVIWAGVALVVGASLWAWAGDIVPMSLLVRRLIVTPGLLAGAYFDFFAGREPIAWSHGLLSDWIVYPLPEPYPSLISMRYLFGEEGSANVHFLSDAFAQLHYAGVAVIGLATALLLWIADGMAARLPRGVAVAALAMPFSALVNSAFNTSLVTHGILLSMLLLLFVEEERTCRPPMQASPPR